MGKPQIYMGFPGSSAGKESVCNVGNPGSIPGSRSSPGEGKGYAFQYSRASLDLGFLFRFNKNGYAGVLCGRRVIVCAREFFFQSFAPSLLPLLCPFGCQLACAFAHALMNV